MQITFDIRPEDDIEDNIDIWVDVDMLPVHLYVSLSNQFVK